MTNPIDRMEKAKAALRKAILDRDFDASVNAEVSYHIAKADAQQAGLLE